MNPIQTHQHSSPSRLQSLFAVQGWLVPLLLVLVLTVVSRYNFLLFHTLAELFAIMVAILLAVVAWYTYGFSRNHFLMFLGIGYFWIGILDLMHTLSFKGMGVLALEGANSSTQFWIVTRYLEALLLLCAPLFFKYRVPKLPIILLFATGSGIATYLILQGMFPAMFINDVGLTQLKIISEYVIVGILFVAIALLTWLRAMVDSRIYKLMIASILCSIAAELSFTLYIDVYSLPIFSGHIIKLISYWLIFLAVVHTSLKEPYQILSRASSTYDTVPDPTIVVDNQGRITQVNKAAEIVVGMSRHELLEKDCHSLFHPGRTSKKDCVVCQNISASAALKNYELYYPDNSEFYEITLTPFYYQSESKGMVHVMHNVTEKKHTEAELVHNANYDALTDFPNRVLAIDRLEQAINQTQRSKLHTAVLFVDLDNFKNINDSLGHRFGDRVLIQVANLLQKCVRKSDTVARWGGDEFLVIIPDLRQLTDVEKTVSKIFAGLADPIEVEGKEFRMTASIGIAGYPDDGGSADSLLSNADAAMYQAKRAGKNTSRFYTQGMNEQAAERLAMEARLRRAFVNNEFYMVYQPSVDLETGRIVAAEALMRWESSELGMVSPELFIPAAEESGQIIEMGDWAIRQVCRDLVQMNEQGFDEGRLAFNVSSRQLSSSNFVRYLADILDEYGLEPARLKIEITESLLLEEDYHTLDILRELRDMGIGLSLDDFGTGYSSLSYLKQFPFTEIKIDRSFVQDVETSENDRQLCNAIVAMAQSLELKVVAEGVETEGQLRILQAYGTNSAQGFLFSRPVRIEKFIALIQRGPFPLSA